MQWESNPRLQAYLLNICSLECQASVAQVCVPIANYTSTWISSVIFEGGLDPLGSLPDYAPIRPWNKQAI